MPQENNKSWSEDLEGKEVENFRLGGFVGKGKIGFVYKAYHKDLPDTEFAVKLVFRALKSGWDTELKKVSKLNLVQGVVHYHTHGESRITHLGDTQLCLYTVWDYIPPGENLITYLERVKSINTSFLLAVTERILHVLHGCEAKGVSRHGDLHAGNILIGSEELETYDDSMQRRQPIFVSDFGYGATGGEKSPKDDYIGLAEIINMMIARVGYAMATATHKQILQAIKPLFAKLLRESQGTERCRPLDILHLVKEIKEKAQCGKSATPPIQQAILSRSSFQADAADGPGVGQFQVSEMIGERWDWWKKLFVPTVPARSKILALDIPTVVTGPRGCGKTMLFRRLSERLMVECGPVLGLPDPPKFVAFYVNANDIADAFAHFPSNPSSADEARLICFANLCVLADLLAVESARSARNDTQPSAPLLELVKRLLISDTNNSLILGEDRLEKYRSILEQTKWLFPTGSDAVCFQGYHEMSQHRWLPHFAQQARNCCSWIGDRAILLFVDDYSTPRVSESIQRVLNRSLLQRSPEILTKVATEAWTTFVPLDSSGKSLQDGDDFQLVDLGEESLFLPDDERLVFLNEVFSRRLSVDQRIPRDCASLRQLLGHSALSKTEFARRLRLMPSEQGADEQTTIVGTSQRRGRSRSRVNYFGDDVFSNLWSGDTRTMIQLISDVVDQAADAGNPASLLSFPIEEALQDRAFRNRGSEWLNSHTRNEPTNPIQLQNELAAIQMTRPNYKLSGRFGDHLKAIVEAFVAAASELLHGPTYTIRENGHVREVPRMAFRIEIVDEFRISGLAEQIYRDLIRYGLFMRDNRGKSVRGAFVPRLYLRRLLLPYGTLALSKRDSVSLSCSSFIQLLLEPDIFRETFIASRNRSGGDTGQMTMFGESAESGRGDPLYDDLGERPEE
ncbi:MAG: hypothetical protein IH604_15985 [Burkholderiales bacterium]|nr:hypothetical protein [Burkholderiales bacterium]